MLVYLGRCSRRPTYARASSAASSRPSRPQHCRQLEPLRPSRSSTSSPERTSARPPMRGASLSERRSSSIPRSSAQQSARIDHLIGDACEASETAAEGGFVSAVPAGLRMPSTMCTIITGMPAASAKSAEGARAPMASPSAAQVAAARLRVPTSAARGSRSPMRQWRRRPKPPAKAASRGSSVAIFASKYSAAPYWPRARSRSMTTRSLPNRSSAFISAIIDMLMDAYESSATRSAIWAADGAPKRPKISPNTRASPPDTQSRSPFTHRSRQFCLHERLSSSARRRSGLGRRLRSGAAPSVGEGRAGGSEGRAGAIGAGGQAKAKRAGVPIMP
mmetsp:Transcript_35894/g.115445  ORF Transcript_35894/g.115445 Transcript_35894/m.115445 type:complete len:333 (-) Transcript_35894:2-1000(-)